MTKHEEFFGRFICALAIREHRADSYQLTARDFRFLNESLHHPPIQISRDDATYLFKCCHQVNRFFEGAFELFINDISDLDGMCDEHEVGKHWLLHHVGYEGVIINLIEMGHFNPSNI